MSRQVEDEAPVRHAQPSVPHRTHKAEPLTAKHDSHDLKPTYPLAAFLLPLKNVSPWKSVTIILLVAGLFRWALSFWGFSGYQKPPMFGDFEAQRHWMEITTSLPVSHWYWHDLEWWGLDYPPLTAYHSWILGKIGNAIDKSWFTLYTSRGLESRDLKTFMRATVLVSEYMVMVPAVLYAVRGLRRVLGVGSWHAKIALAAILMQPATLLIDHGHFQYNTVMLGFVTATIAAMLHGDLGFSCVCFVAALGFKQMALFYAPVVFAYLAGVCLFPRLDFAKLIRIALSTVCSFGALYLPLLLGTAHDIQSNVPLPSDHQMPPLLAALPTWVSEKSIFYPHILQILQSIHRIFPFSRGLFEDKVANIWCAIHSSGAIKLHKYDAGLLSRAALGLTTIAILPSCLIIFFKPRRENVLLAFASCAWGFFLCSYQVHEKNVLLPLLPMTLLLASDDGLQPDLRAWIGFANTLASWTLYPLLKRDGLGIPYAILLLLWIWLLGLPPISWQTSLLSSSPGRKLSLPVQSIHILFYAGMITWHIGEMFVLPPSRFPDMWVVGNAVLGAAGFSLCYLWCLWQLALRSGVLSRLYQHSGLVKKTQ